MSRFALLTVSLFALVVASEKPCAGADTDEVKKIAKDLKHKDAKVRLKAAEKLGALGKDAIPVVRELCDAILDPDAKVSLAAFKAIEGARPDLYKPLSKLILDANSGVKWAGVRELGELKAEAEPVANLLTQYLVIEAKADKKVVLDSDQLERTIYQTLREIGSEDPDIIKTFKVLAGPTTKSISRRKEAMKTLVLWAGMDNDRRKELLPLIKSALATTGMITSAIELTEQYADLCKDFLPTLKQFKLSKETDVRDAATKAVEAIEGK